MRSAKVFSRSTNSSSCWPGPSGAPATATAAADGAAASPGWVPTVKTRPSEAGAQARLCPPHLHDTGAKCRWSPHIQPHMVQNRGHVTSRGCHLGPTQTSSCVYRPTPPSPPRESRKTVTRASAQSWHILVPGAEGETPRRASARVPYAVGLREPAQTRAHTQRPSARGPFARLVPQNTKRRKCPVHSSHQHTLRTHSGPAAPMWGGPGPAAAIEREQERAPRSSAAASAPRATRTHTQLAHMAGSSKAAHNVPRTSWARRG